jgi:hypothetical protein
VGDKKYIQKFEGKISCKTTNRKIINDMKGKHQDECDVVFCFCYTEVTRVNLLFRADNIPKLIQRC